MTPSPAAARVSAESEAGVLELRPADELVDEARDRRREGEPPALSVRAEQAEEEQQLLLDRHFARLVVDEVDALAALVEDDAEVGADRCDQPLRLAERLRQARGDGNRGLAAVRVRSNGLHAERSEHHRQDERGGGLRVVDDDAERARVDGVGVERGQEVFHISLDGPGRERDPPHFVPRSPAKLLPEEVLLHFLDELRRRLDAGGLEDLQLERLRIGAAGAHVHAGR